MPIPIKIPRDVLPGHGGVSVATTSTLMGGQQDAIKNLIDYPHGCVEQTSSKLLPLVPLGDLRETFRSGPGRVRTWVPCLTSTRSRRGPA